MRSASGTASGACYVQGVLWAVVPAVAVWTLCGLSCDRYAAIASPLHYSRLVNTRRTCAFLGVSWIVAAGAAVPPLVGVCPYSYGPSRCVCVAACAGSGADSQAPASSPVGLGYALSYVWLSLVFPASLIAASNLQVLLIARTHRHRIVAAIYEVSGALAPVAFQAARTSQQSIFCLPARSEELCTFKT
ncbi:hypothetical protein HPB51_005232 [Rhipicephalus microplus]|uniref:G-protein coupled receptors family 1 profile domain-containing protein n=1 Tax=Rhipicephalus microplus TaxID=6941 RepID=A0A9J6EX23_RHIMP|nr:hypothetical protein HPB51_005232 [Rhipicephalus microplus]